MSATMRAFVMEPVGSPASGLRRPTTSPTGRWWRREHGVGAHWTGRPGHGRTPVMTNATTQAGVFTHVDTRKSESLHTGRSNARCKLASH